MAELQLDEVNSSPTILIVENDSILRRAVADLLQAEGFSVLHAASAVQALKALHGRPLPALAILDLDMPLSDGRQFLQRLRRTPRLRALKVLVLSAERPRRERSRGIGIDFWISKPADPDMLLRKISCLCRSSEGMLLRHSAATALHGTSAHD